MAFGQYLGYIVGAVGAVVGGVLGFVYGGPGGLAYGAWWGFSIGSMVGGVAGQVFWPEQAELNLPPPPQPHETRVQFSSWGMPIPIQYDSGRMAGNIIYMSDINQTVDRRSHRQDGVRYYEIINTYTATFAIAFCEGPVESIARIWMNNKVLVDYRDPEGAYYPGAGELAEANLETTIARQQAYFRIYIGTESQSADPAIAALITADETPAYRGLCYIVFIDFPIGEFSGVPNMEVEIGAIPHGIWKERQPIDTATHEWTFAASDGDGSTLLVGSGSSAPGYMYKSDDYGLTWLQVGPSKYWRQGCLNQTGQYGMAVDYSRLYITANYGVTWTEARPVGDADRVWCDVAISTSGAVMLVVANNQRIYKSVDYGASWVEQQPLGNVNAGWWRCACSKDGTVLMAALSITSVYISTDSGVNWVERKPTGGATGVIWHGFDCSADGSTIVITQDNGRVYVSRDTGATWAEKRPAGNASYFWRGAACNNAGNYIAVSLTAGNMYLSDDYGETWASLSPGLGLVPGSVDIDDSGANLIICNALTYSGRIYTYRT